MAASSLSLQVEGGRALRAALKKAESDFKDLKAANKGAASIVAARARQTVPVKTGRLQRSIRAAGTKTSGMVRAGNNTTTKYANIIQWGWFRQNILPTFFLSTAATETEPVWIQQYAQNMNKIIESI